jgi:hypothetical protein
MNLFKKIIPVIVLAITVSSCSEKVVPQRPQTESNTTFVPTKESVISLPLTIKVATIQTLINKEIPQTLYSGPVEGGTITVVKDGNIQFSVQNNNLVFNVPLKVQAHLCKSINAGFAQYTKCGDGNAKLSIKIITSLKFTDNYSVVANSQFIPNISDAHLRINVGSFPIDLDIKDYIDGPLKKASEQYQGKLNQMIAEQIDKINIKSYVAKYWALLGQPVNISNYAFVEIDPKAILIQNFKADANVVQLKVGVKANVSVVSGNPKTYSNPLPKLNIVNDMDNKFYVYLPVHLAFDSLSNKLNQFISNKTYTDDAKNYEVEVKNIELYGNGNAIVVGMDFKGKAKKMHKKAQGRLYFNVIPEFDVQNNVIKVKDYHLSLETGSLLNDKGLTWVTNTLFSHKMKESLKYDVGKSIAEYKTMINNQLKEIKLQNLTINGKMESLNFESFQFSDKSIDIILSANGVLNTQPIKME